MPARTGYPQSSRASGLGWGEPGAGHTLLPPFSARPLRAIRGGRRRTMRRWAVSRIAASLFAVLVGLLSSTSARAMCDVVPGATNVFRGATGSMDRPFAMPGDVVEVRVRPAVCDGESPGLVDLP